MIQPKKERKLLGTRNGLKIFTPLRAKVGLKTNKTINKVSEKQKEKNKIWAEITDAHCVELNFICQWCKLKGTRNSNDFNRLEGHHIIPRRFNVNTMENNYIAHRGCHQFITDNNINTNIYKDKKAWEDRDVEA